MELSKQNVARAVAALTLAAAGFLASPAPVGAVGPGGGCIAPMGIVAGETARLNLARFPDPPGAQLGACALTLQFIDSQGGILASSTATIGADQAVLLDFPAPAQRLGPPGGQGEVHDHEQQHLPGSAIRRLTFSVEVFDNATGRTTVVASGHNFLLGAMAR